MNNKSPLLTPALRWFLFAMILANISGRMMFPLLPVYLAQELGATVGQIGLVFTLASLVPILLLIFGDWLSDTIGRLRAIALASAAATFGYVSFVVATSWQWIVVALALEYISGAVVMPSYGAFIADQSSEEHRGRVFGTANSIFMVVGVVGPPLGGWLVLNYGYRAMLVISAVLYASATLLRIWMATAVRFNAETRSERPTLASFKLSLKTMVGMLAAGGVFTWMLLTDGVRDVAFRLSNELQPLYFSQVGGLDAQQIGWLASAVALAMMVTTPPAGWLSDRIGERPTIVGGFLLQFLGFAIFLQSASFTGFAAAMVVFGIGVGVTNPAFDSLVTKAVPEKIRGIGFGLFHTSLGIISLPAPYLGARLWERFSPRTPFVLTAVAALVSVLPVWFKFKLPERSAPGEGAEPVIEPDSPLPIN